MSVYGRRLTPLGQARAKITRGGGGIVLEGWPPDDFQGVRTPPLEINGLSVMSGRRQKADYKASEYAPHSYGTCVGPQSQKTDCGYTL
jgi:hypothetical protein